VDDGRVVDEGWSRAIDLLEHCAGEAGFVASPSLPHYAAVWARDAAITSLGANVSGNPALVATSRRTLETLARLQSPLGQIPNAYWPARGYWDWGEAGCTDATALFVIAAEHHVRATGDAALAAALWPAVGRALTWLRYQDANNVGLIDSPAGGDWMDSTLNRHGKVFHVNVLYQRAAWAAERLAGGLGQPAVADAEGIRRRLNLLFWPEAGADFAGLLAHVTRQPGADASWPHQSTRGAWQAAVSPDRWHYLAGVSWGRVTDVCDVLANLLAVLWGVAEGERAGWVLDGLAAAGVDTPYPSRCWPDAIGAEGPGGELLQAAEGLQHPRWRNPPYHYHNGAVWPYVGGFSVLAHLRAGRRADAEAQLAALAAANRLGEGRAWGFHEWIEPRTGQPLGAADQAWNAGMYLLAYRAVADGAATV
ncbi:MAG TPA: hypothetical protein VFN57_19315, partial [Thermomicrobiaceae bacterium]|nr:hypothetical protein [Thermomicrobiaceae bacterium]